MQLTLLSHPPTDKPLPCWLLRCRYSTAAATATTYPTWNQPAFVPPTSWLTGKTPMGYSTDISAWVPSGWATTLPDTSVTTQFFFRWGPPLRADAPHMRPLLALLARRQLAMKPPTCSC